MSNEIQIRDLDVVFRTESVEIHALRGVTVTLEPDRITGLIGESGSGKSVLAMSILRLLPEYAAVQGSIQYQGQELLTVPRSFLRTLRRKEIGLIPQNPSESLNPSRRIGPQAAECFEGDKKRKRERVLCCLASVGFAAPQKIMRQYPYQLSGGMKQRVLSLFGMRDGLRWIIADEPTKGLDASAIRQTSDSLKSLAGKGAGGMLVITHDLKLARTLCDEIAVFYEGELVEKGRTHEIFSEPLHPYTAGLLRAMPENGMYPMPPKGEVPVNGCLFCKRCSKKTERCGREHPQLYDTDHGRKVRCFFCGEGNGARGSCN